MKFFKRLFRRKLKVPQVPVREEDEFLRQVYCAAHDWEPEVEHELARAKRPRAKNVARRKHA